MPPPRSLSQRRRDAETQRIHENSARGEVLAAERRPRTAGTSPSSDRERSSLEFVPAACALGAQASPLLRRPRHFSPLFNGWEGHTSFPNRRKARRNRRAPGASAGGKPGCDERLRSEQTGFSPAVGDRQIAGCSAINPRHYCITSATTSLRPLRLCGFLGRAALRLCVSVFLLCVSVSLWFSRCLGGSPGRVGGKFEIRNSKFEI